MKTAGNAEQEGVAESEIVWQNRKQTNEKLKPC